MLRRLLRLAPSKDLPRAAAGSRAYAVGDVHGRLDLLEDILAQVEQDNARRPPANTYLVLLGDLVDRGPDSCGVIEHLLTMRTSLDRTIYLKGNHEEFLLDILQGNDAAIPQWLTYGGYECAESYGLSLGWILNARPQEIGDRLRAAVPATHREFLEDMADSFRFGDYCFVHAGIRPGVALSEQTGQDLRWIREDFLNDRSDHGFVIVHGHTIVAEPEQHGNRIAVDTGAYRSGVLTAVAIEGAERWFLSTNRSDQAAAA